MYINIELKNIYISGQSDTIDITVSFMMHGAPELKTEGGVARDARCKVGLAPRAHTVKGS